MRYLSLVVSLILAACTAFGTGEKRLKTVTYQTAKQPSDTLLVLLPGLYDRPGDFNRAHFMDSARAASVPADLMTVNASYAYYRSRTILSRLQTDVIGPARRAGYKQIWLVGISLGGLGALLYLKAHPQDLAGVVLMSPYLGEDKLIARIAASGSLTDWQPDPECSADSICALWEWLREFSKHPPDQRTPVLLGYGDRDRFATAHRLLAEALGRKRTVTVAGGHDWQTWQQLWRQFLAGPWAGALTAQAVVNRKLKK